jgi:alpha/beta superfamily hydrolase
MARMNDLPPPPEHLSVSPPVRLPGEEAVRIEGLAGEPAISALVRGDRRAGRAVLLCHPHPLYGGTMHSAVVLALARGLAERGQRIATLRFDYRGVGESGGSYGDGLGETRDARAALRFVRERFPVAAIAVVGYSFGTWVGLRAAAIEQTAERVALIAPAVRVFDFVREDGAAFQGRLAVYLGDLDEFCDVAEAQALAANLGASLTVLPGNDHMFRAGRRKLADTVVPFLDPPA